MTVSGFKDGIHSGHSGTFADTFLVATNLLTRVQDTETYMVKDEFQVEIPQARQDEIREISKIYQFKNEAPLLEGVLPIPTLSGDSQEEQNYQSYLNETWKTTLTIIGANGLPDPTSAGNVLRKSTTLGLSFRLPPTQDALEFTEKVQKVLEADVPFGYKVTFCGIDASNGWNANPLSEKLSKSLEESSEKYFGTKPLFVGTGGAIPFVDFLGNKFPKADFLVTGSSRPDCGHHGPNEKLHIPTTKWLIQTLT